jgi:hypothetical protein
MCVRVGGNLVWKSAAPVFVTFQLEHAGTHRYDCWSIRSPDEKKRHNIYLVWMDGTISHKIYHVRKPDERMYFFYWSHITWWKATHLQVTLNNKMKKILNGIFSTETVDLRSSNFSVKYVKILNWRTTKFQWHSVPPYNCNTKWT